MLICVPKLLSKDDVARFRREMAKAEWVDGRETAGVQAASVKNNLQLPPTSETAVALGRDILQAIGRNNLFLSAALPLKFLPPMFNRYGEGNYFATHVDNAIRRDPLTGTPLRTDVSCTVFLAESDEYDGGELVVEDHYGAHEVKLEAGDAVLYPATSLHQVTPVTRGERIASFFWIQSMVREDSRRSMLFDLDVGIQRLAHENPDHPSAVQLTGVYHNLLRMWADV